MDTNFNKVVPFGRNVLVRRTKPEKITESGIALPDSTVEAEHAAATTGVVVSKGCSAWEAFPEIECEVGDTVVFKKYGGLPVSRDVFSEILIADTDIFGKFVED